MTKTEELVQYVESLEPLADAGADTVKGLLEQYNKLYTDSKNISRNVGRSFWNNIISSIQLARVDSTAQRR